MKSLSRIQLKCGKYKLLHNQVVTKRSWLLCQKTVVEQKTIGCIEIASNDFDKIVTVYRDGSRLGKIRYCSKNTIISVWVYVGLEMVLMHPSQQGEFCRYVDSLLWKADEIKKV